MPHLSASEVTIHEEALYQVYVPSTLPRKIFAGRMPFLLLHSIKALKELYHNIHYQKRKWNNWHFLATVSLFPNASINVITSTAVH